MKNKFQQKYSHRNLREWKYSKINRGKGHTAIICKRENANDANTCVIVYQSELDCISQHILDCKHIETGGQLFGFYTAKGTPVVCYAIGPGANANHQVAFFNQDIGYLSTVGDILVRMLGLQHIGEWHSHHQLGLTHPSGHDYNTVHTTVERQHLGQFLLCIGTCTETAATINAFRIKEGSEECTECKWIVKAIESPYRKIANELLKGILLHPITQEPSLTNMKIERITASPQVDTKYLLRTYSKKTI